MFINNFDPVAFQIMSFEIRWYSLAYIFGILAGWWLGKKILVFIPSTSGKFLFTELKSVSRHATLLSVFWVLLAWQDNSHTPSALVSSLVLLFPVEWFLAKSELSGSFPPLSLGMWLLFSPKTSDAGMLNVLSDLSNNLGDDDGGFSGMGLLLLMLLLLLLILFAAFVFVLGGGGGAAFCPWP